MGAAATTTGPRGPARWAVPTVALLCAAGAVLAVDTTAVPTTTYAATSSLAHVLDLTAGVGMVLAGAVLWLVRPGAPAVLAVAVGCAWSAQDVVGSPSAPALVRSLALVVAPLLLALLVHLVLGWPSGAVVGRGPQVLIGLAYACAVVVAVGQALLRDPLLDRYCWRTCGDNVFLLRADVDAAQALQALALWSAPAVALLVTAACAGRLLRATAPARAGTAAVLTAAVAGAVAEAGYAVLLLLVPREVPDEGLFPTVFLLRAVALSALAAGLLRAAVRAARTRAAVRRLAHDLLEAPAPGRLRDVLARSVGDEGLQVAYWLEQAHRYVDATGRPVEPRPAPHQVATSIVRGGSTVAVVVHDRSLRETYDLQREVGSAARLAVDNERLRAEVLYRLEDLRASQARVVDRADATRRRLERDLHDGAQQRLITVSYELRLALADARADGSAELAQLLEQATRQATDALAELRELAHGIFPAILADAGLGPALRTLAAGAVLPVEVLEVTGDRCAPAAETAAYVVVVEGIADAVRRSASYVTVQVERAGDQLVVQLEDDGGERDRSALLHLDDRVGALGGRLSTAGPGLRADVPCG